jgi:hypothetical protein
MSRISYSDEEDYPGQFELWQANCARSLKGKQGQEELRALRDALIALPDKRLIHGALVDKEGGVCAIGAWAQSKGLDLQKFDPEDATDEVGIEAGMPGLVAWKVVEMNDMEFRDRWDSAQVRVVELAPEQRYIKMLAWVEGQLV